MAALLFRLKQKDEKDAEAGAALDAVPMILDIAKSRNGPTGDIELTFLKSYTRFESAAKISPEDMPQNK